MDTLTLISSVTSSLGISVTAANRLTLSGLGRNLKIMSQGSRKLEPRAEISERLRRIGFRS